MSECTNTLQKLQDNINKVIVGSQRTTELLLVCLAAGGHVLIEDVPGTGKTMLAKSLAASASLSFSRIQFTPDLLPGDVTGLNYFDQSKSRFVFREGPVFCHILLADEINRATPRTQSALLECMAEHQVTVDGQTRPLEDPFFVIATQNPVETLGTFPLPEAQLDRFLMQISMGIMTQEEELSMIDRFIEDQPLARLQACCDAKEIRALRTACRNVFVHPDLRLYITQLIRCTRELSGSVPSDPAYTGSGGSFASDPAYAGSGGSFVSDPAGGRASSTGVFPGRIPRLEEGVSPRGTLALVRASQGLALVRGREYVTPEDIQECAIPVLAHRCLFQGISSAKEKEDRILTALARTEVPTENWKRG
jgi:MoxR-like ATPase